MILFSATQRRLRAVANSLGSQVAVEIVKANEAVPEQLPDLINPDR